MRRLRAGRPSPRRLSAALAILGLVAGMAFLLVPVEAAFGDDPLMRLQPFSPTLAASATQVDCGLPVGNLGRRSDGLSISRLASDDACRRASARRVASAVAVAALIGVLALIGLAGAGDRRGVAA